MLSPDGKKKSPEHSNMGSSFVDLTTIDLKVKPDRPDGPFERYMILRLKSKEI